MITCALMDMLTTLLAGLYSALPDWSLDIGAVAGNSGGDIPDLQYTVTSTTDPLTTLLIWLQKYNSFFPFDQLVIMVGALATFVTAMLAYKAALKIAGMIRGAGTS